MNNPPRTATENGDVRGKVTSVPLGESWSSIVFNSSVRVLFTFDVETV